MRSHRQKVQMEKKTERMSLRLLSHLKVTRGEGYSRAKEIETEGLGVGGKAGKNEFWKPIEESVPRRRGVSLWPVLTRKRYWPFYLTRWKFGVKPEKIGAVSSGVVGTKWVKDWNGLRRRWLTTKVETTYIDKAFKVFYAKEDEQEIKGMFFLCIA